MSRKRATHTPGPWKVDENEELPLAVIRDTEEGWGIAEISGGRTEEAKANARLMAASPDLLAALKQLQAALSEYRLLDVRKRFSLSLAHAAAGEAIHKAEGR